MRTQAALSQLQVLNGLLDRPDWKDAVRMPIGVLPCGSGNALAGAVNHRGGYVDCFCLWGEPLGPRGLVTLKPPTPFP